MTKYGLIVTSLDNFRVNNLRNFDVDGFNLRWKGRVEKVKPGDKFVYYITKLQRIGAISEAISGGYYDDKTKIWIEEDEIWPCRFKTRPLLILDEGQMLDIKKLVPQLSFITAKQKATSWALAFQQSLREIPQKDFQLIESEMVKIESGKTYTSESNTHIKEAPQRDISMHKELVEIIDNIGKCLGMVVEREHTISEYRHDIVWKKKQFLPPSVVIEVCDGGSLEKDILSLGWANENLDAKTILVIAKENDFYQAKRRLPTSSQIVVVKAESVIKLGELVQSEPNLLKAVFQ